MRIVLITLILATTLGGGVAYAWVYYGGFVGEGSTGIAFIEVYGDYAEVANRVEMMVHVPGVAENENRGDLLSLLSTILTEDIDDTERERLARIAFSHVDTMKKEIDQAQAGQAELYRVLQDLGNAAAQFRGLEAQDLAGTVVSQARERAELSSRITSILSETNDHTYAIVTQILEEKGSLSDEHVQAINAATTGAEDRFDDLTRLYNDLIQRRADVETSMQTFAEKVI